MLLEVRLCTLAPSPNTNGDIIKEISTGIALIQMRSSLVKSSDKQPDAVWSAAVLLSVNLRLVANCANNSENGEGAGVEHFGAHALGAHVVSISLLAFLESVVPVWVSSTRRT